MLSSESEHRINREEIPSLVDVLDADVSDFDPGYILFMFESNWSHVEDQITESERDLLKLLVDSYGTGVFCPLG